jgi:hypothetical protein
MRGTQSIGSSAWSQPTSPCVAWNTMRFCSTCICPTDAASISCASSVNAGMDYRSSSSPPATR